MALSPRGVSVMEHHFTGTEDYVCAFSKGSSCLHLVFLFFFFGGGGGGEGGGL